MAQASSLSCLMKGGVEFMTLFPGEPCHLRPHFLPRRGADDLTAGCIDRDYADVPDDAWTCSVFGMGSIAPARTLDAAERHRLGYGDWVIERPMAEAVRGLEAHSGKRIGALVAFELGAGNTAGPIDAGTRLDIPVVDGDYAGRAVPELAQVLPAVYGRALCPCAICDPWGNRLVLLATPSAKVGERVGKLVSLATKVPDPAATCAHAGFLLSGREMKRLVIPGTISRALAVGRRIREARAAGTDAARAAAGTLGEYKLLRAGTTAYAPTPHPPSKPAEPTVAGARTSHRSMNRSLP